jgi:hypothetical protein
MIALELPNFMYNGFDVNILQSSLNLLNIYSLYYLKIHPYKKIKEGERIMTIDKLKPMFFPKK